MTAAGTPEVGVKARYAALPRRVRHRLAAVCLLRAGFSAAVLVLLYYRLPLVDEGDSRVGAGLAVGLLAFAGVVGVQAWQITRAEYPLLRAVEALATAVPLFLLIFAGSYYVLGGTQVGSFSEPLSRTDALYYTVTVFSTVGFGDITPRTGPARVVTMLQMLANLLVFGVGVRVLVSAVSAGLRRRAGTAGSPDPR